MTRRYLELLHGIAGFANETLSNAATAARARVLVEAYRRRRERYWAEAQARALSYDGARVGELTRARLRERNIAPQKRRLGEVHTLAFMPLVSWHAQLLAPMRTLGPLSHFDYVAHGVEVDALFRHEPAAVRARHQANVEFERFAAAAASQRPVDWVFVYASGLEVLASTLAQVRGVTRAPIVGMCLDDKQSWEREEVGGQRGGQIDIAGTVDLAWTSARVACEWYLVEGGNPLFLGEGCSPEVFHPGTASEEVDVCFVGQAYGFRRGFLKKLRQRGVSVATAGRGWPQGVISDESMVKIFQRSKIILGMGGIGWSEGLKNVKGRDFDAPCTGGGVYLTSYNPDLAQFFRIGDEIACYGTQDEAVEAIRWLLADTPRRRAMAASARARCIREHTWEARFVSVLATLGILPPPDDSNSDGAAIESTAP